MNLDIKELRRRWTIELNSLGRRNSPSQEQTERKRDLQIFLCSIDPLRKYEQDWRNLPGLQKKLELELQLQNSVSSKQYTDSFYAKVLIAMTGKAVANPSEACVINQKVKMLCEDHGEVLSNVLSNMHRENILRKEYKSDSYTVSTVGTILMEKHSLRSISPAASSNYQGSPLLNGLNKDAVGKLAELHAQLNINSADKTIRTIPKQVVRPDNPPVKKPVEIKNPAIQPIKEDVKPVKVLDVLAKIEALEKHCPNVAVVFDHLKKHNVIKVKRHETTVTETINKADNRPYSEWTSVLVIDLIPYKVFISKAPNRKLANSGNYEKMIEALKLKYSATENPAYEFSHIPNGNLAVKS